MTDIMATLKDLVESWGFIIYDTMRDRIVIAIMKPGDRLTTYGCVSVIGDRLAVTTWPNVIVGSIPLGDPGLIDWLHDTLKAYDP